MCNTLQLLAFCCTGVRSRRLYISNKKMQVSGLKFEMRNSANRKLFQAEVLKLIHGINNVRKMIAKMKRNRVLHINADHLPLFFTRLIGQAVCPCKKSRQSHALTKSSSKNVQQVQQCSTAQLTVAPQPYHGVIKRRCCIIRRLWASLVLSCPPRKNV